jgi:hypothetical protein
VGKSGGKIVAFESEAKLPFFGNFSISNLGMTSIIINSTITFFIGYAGALIVNHLNEKRAK